MNYKREKILRDTRKRVYDQRDRYEEALNLILCKRESYDSEEEVLKQIFSIAHEALAGE